MTPSLASKLPDVGTTIFTVMSRLAEECGAVNLGQGFPDFEPPEALRAALGRAASSGKNQYAPMAGLPRLRELLAARLGARAGRSVDAEHEVTITSGATEALFDAVAAVVRPGDEVVLLDPAYDSYEPSVRLLGGRAVRVPLRLPDFSIDFERLRAALSPRTRLLAINFPHNPSGAVLAPGALDELAALLRDTNVLVLSDEVYESLVYDGRKPESVLAHPELAERSFAVGSFGKVFHATGWKVGWVTAPRELSAELRKVHQFVTFSTSTPAQHALAEVLESAPEELDSLASFYQKKRDYFRELLRPTPLRLLDAPGTYFQLVDYSSVSNLGDLEFAQVLTRELGVAAIPLSPFYETPPAAKLVRFCFAKREQTLAEAAARLAKLQPIAG
jgi:methionine aminotransferase